MVVPTPVLAAIQANALPKLMYFTSQVGLSGCCCKLYSSLAELVGRFAGSAYCPSGCSKHVMFHNNKLKIIVKSFSWRAFHMQTKVSCK